MFLQPALLGVAAVLASPSAGQVQQFARAVSDGDAALVRKLASAQPLLPSSPEPGGSLPLQNAIRAGRTDVAKLLVELGADVRGREQNGFTALHIAADYRNKEVVALLIAKGADVNAGTESDAFTPLHYAARSGGRDVAELLLAKGADVNGGHRKDAFRPTWTPLIWAARERQREVVILLLAKGANVNLQRPGYAESALITAVQNEDWDLAELLLDRGADPNAGGVFAMALGSGRRDVAELFLTKGADPNPPEALAAAAASGNLELVKLIAARMRPDAKGSPRERALHTAAGGAHHDVIRWLLDQGADPNGVRAEGIFPLHAAHDRESAAILLARGADLDTRTPEGFSPMRSAVDAGRIDVAEFLESKGVGHDVFTAAALGRPDRLRGILRTPERVNARGGWTKQTPLHYAARYGRVAAAEALWAKEPDVNAGDDHGKTPLHVAAESGQPAMVKWLIARKANVNAKLIRSLYVGAESRPLDLALAQGHAEVVGLLMDAGAETRDGPVKPGAQLATAMTPKRLGLVKLFLARGAPVDTKGSDGAQAIHVAAEAGDLAFVKELLGKGLSPQAKGAHGWTPLDYAVQGGHLAIAELLATDGDAVRRNTTLLPAAVSRGHTDLVEFLLARGAKAAAASLPLGTLLSSAAAVGKPEVVKLLLTKGGLDARKDVGPLHHAALAGHRDAAEALIAAGADVNAVPKDDGILVFMQYSPSREKQVLRFFAITGPEAVKERRRWDAIPEVNGSEPFALTSGTPLQLAVAGKKPEVVDLLLTKGADVNGRFPNGSTPLHLAAFLGDVPTAKLLLAKGTDVNAKNAAGETPMRLATMQARPRMSAFLHERGGKE